MADIEAKARECGDMRRHHDMGGEPAGPVEREEHDYAPWEKRVDALLRLLTARRVMTVDELRRGIEELGPGAYDELSYYQRWIASIGNNLLEKGVVGVDELGQRMAEVEARWREAGREGRRAS
jgi:nitrile hydratase subunit beta